MLKVFRDSGLDCQMRPEGSVMQVDIVLDEIETYLDAMAARERSADAASLSSLLRPASVVVIGAGRRRGSVGYAVLENILAAGFTGELYAVNPHTDRILGVPAYPSVVDLPATCDVAIICVPAAAVADIAEQCGRYGVHALVVITAGLTGTPEQER